MGTPRRGRQERDSGQVAKLVDVYAIRFLKETKTRDIKDGSFAYTVMCKAPSDCVVVRYEPMKVALRQALGNRSAEIGIASFADHAPIRHYKQHAFRRRFPARTGQRRRPRKSKNQTKELRLWSSPSTPPFSLIILTRSIYQLSDCHVWWSAYHDTRSILWFSNKWPYSRDKRLDFGLV